MKTQDLKIAIGKNIRMKRWQAELTLTALAEALGVSYQQVQKYEKGVNAPPCDKLILLAKIFQCSIDELMPTETEILVSEQGAHTDNPWMTQGATTLVNHFSRIPHRRVRHRICSLVKVIADAALSE